MLELLNALLKWPYLILVIDVLFLLALIDLRYTKRKYRQMTERGDVLIERAEKLARDSVENGRLVAIAALTQHLPAGTPGAIKAEVIRSVILVLRGTRIYNGLTEELSTELLTEIGKTTEKIVDIACQTYSTTGVT